MGKFYFRPMPGEQINTELTPGDDALRPSARVWTAGDARPRRGGAAFPAGPDESMTLVSRS
jgi:hypothetical protein